MSLNRRADACIAEHCRTQCRSAQQQKGADAGAGSAMDKSHQQYTSSESSRTQKNTYCDSFMSRSRKGKTNQWWRKWGEWLSGEEAKQVRWLMEKGLRATAGWYKHCFLVGVCVNLVTCICDCRPMIYAIHWKKKNTLRHHFSTVWLANI